MNKFNENIDATVDRLANSANTEIRNHRQIRGLVEQALYSIGDYSADNELSVEEFHDLAEDAFNWILRLRDALGSRVRWHDGIIDDPNFEEPNYVWFHEDRMQHHLSLEMRPLDWYYFNVELLDELCFEYLAFPWRSKLIDIVLIDVFVFSEIYGYAVYLFNEPRKSVFSNYLSPICEPHVFILFLVEASYVSAFVVAIIALASWIGTDWSNWSAIGLIGLIFTYGAIGILKLPFDWIEQRRQRKRAIGLLRQMEGLYSELIDWKKTSLKHIYNRLEATSSKGAIWNGILFILMDDIISRGQKFKQFEWRKW
jgi:hypothetical protein